jgi:hypothetical protein
VISDLSAVRFGVRTCATVHDVITLMRQRCPKDHLIRVTDKRRNLHRHPTEDSPQLNDMTAYRSPHTAQRTPILEEPRRRRPSEPGCNVIDHRFSGSRILSSNFVRLVRG